MSITIFDQQRQAAFLVEESAFSGVRRIAHTVAEDLKLASGKTFAVCDHISGQSVILVGTLGRSDLLAKLAQSGYVNLAVLEGKWECYLFQSITVTEAIRTAVPELAGVKELLVIAGSDKRGTIYGLFHLSELAGISPWVWFADVAPAMRDELVITEADLLISKTPSVKYRGFFINDEYPSFGTWTETHFGGFTSEMYIHVFELLLRLKGNYLWPAMWKSNFSLEGPGLRNAELADELGIVMSNSHHEPCLRHSEEWDLVRGEDSPYGNAWNFDQNREGLINYWRDGLRRNGSFENIITMGMRGERDSTILGHDSTMADNVNYLKDVITTQNQLIRETIGEELDNIPRMLALYKEVEAYYYGDETAEGLDNWNELDGITLMLCEDNFGNMRTLPTPDKRFRKGGWGMYYHFDYHGEPVSYEWVNSSWLPKVQEQMNLAYEYGVRDIWVVNVGDLKPQELPLSFFMDMAYDMDAWGQVGTDQTDRYLRKWVDQQFGAFCSVKERADIVTLLDGYTRQNSTRKPETLQPETYHPIHFGESDKLLKKATKLEQLCEALDRRLHSRISDTERSADYAAFYELVYFPVMASMNLVKLQLFSGKNHVFAEQGRVSSNRYARYMDELLQRDSELQEVYHTVMGGKWSGMMLSEHIGFVNWNAEESRLTVRSYVAPMNRARMIVSPKDSHNYTMGGDWTRKTLEMRNFTNPYVTEAVVDIASGGTKPFSYVAAADTDWLLLSKIEGVVDDLDDLTLTVDRDALHAAAVASGNKLQTAHLRITTDFSHANIDVVAMDFSDTALTVPYVSEWGVAIEASSYAEKHDTKAGRYLSVPRLGIFETAEKPMPVTARFTPGVDAPSLVYELELPEDGAYEVRIITTPSNPVTARPSLCFGLQWNDEEIQIINTVSDTFRSGEPSCAEWCKGVVVQRHEAAVMVQGKRGRSRVTLYAVDAPCVIERVVISKPDGINTGCYMGRPSINL